MSKRLLLLLSLLVAGCGAAPRTVTGAPVAAQGAQAEGIFNQPMPVQRLVSDVLTKYDHNRNGSIELNRPDGFWAPLFTRDERFRKETTRSVERDKQGRQIRVVYTTYTYTRRDMFYAADTNHDGVVRLKELQALVESFDQDHNGDLTRRGLWGWITRKEKGEYDLLSARYGEELTDTRRTEVNDLAQESAIEGEATMVAAPTPTEDLKPAVEQPQTP